MTRTQPWRFLLLFTVLSLLLTWPLLPHLLSHVTGDGIDDPALAWNLWWAKSSWVDRAGLDAWVHNPFDGDVMFYPLGINLAFYTLTLLNGALSIPLQGTFGLILSNNLLLLSSFVLSAFGAYLLALEMFATVGDSTRPGVRPDRRVVAALAGLIYAFASAKLFYAALGQFNIVSSQWLPFMVLYLWRSLRLPWRWRNGLMLGLFLLLQTWAELTFGTFGVLLIVLVSLGTLVWAGIWARRQKTAVAVAVAWSVLRSAAIAAVMFVAGLAPYLAAMLPDMRSQGNFLVEGGGFADIFSADLLGFFFPTQLHPLLGNIVRMISHDSALRPDRSQWMVNKGQHLFLGYSVMALAAVALWRYRRQVWLWAIGLLTALFLLLSLGPSLRIGGHDTGIPGLFPLLAKIPFLQANRYPSRFSIVILLGVSLLAALGLDVLRQGWRPSRRRWLTLGVFLLVLFEHLSIPLPLSDLRPPPIYASVSADPRPGALLDLPIGWRNGFNVFGKSDVIIMATQWYQTTHHRPLLGGNTSRNPEQKFQYFMENPVIGVLAALQDGRPVSPEAMQLAQDLAPDLLRTYNIHTVLLHTDKVPPDFSQQLGQLFPLQQVAAQDGIIRYETQWPPQRSSVSLAADAPELRTYLDRGWGVVSTRNRQPLLWASQKQARLILPGFTQPATVELTLFAPVPQNLDLRLDQKPFSRQALRYGINTITLALPPQSQGFPRHLTLQTDHFVTPSMLQIAPRTIGTTGVASPANLVLRSAGKTTGDFGHIYVNGVDVSRNSRGYNLAALDASTGELLDSVVFDTHAPYLEGESERLVAWIGALPAGAIVMGVVRDAAALNLSDAAVQALHQIGVTNDIRGELRRAHAFVGVKGAAAGTALEAVADDWPLTLHVGEGLTAPQPSVALLRLSWQLK